MSNYKALGIDKEMDREFSGHKTSDLQKLIDSQYFNYPHITKRKDGERYCTVMVVDCQAEYFWYKNLIGFTFFCRIRFNRYSAGYFVQDFIGVRLTKSKEIIFRGFDPKDVVII